MDGVLKRLPARFRHPVPNEIGEAIKRFIEGPLRGSREERHRKGLAGFRRLGHSSLTRRSRNQTGLGMMPEWASSY